MANGVSVSETGNFRHSIVSKAVKGHNGRLLISGQNVSIDGIEKM